MIVVFVVVAIVAIAIPVISNRRWHQRQEEETIHETAERERATESARVARVKKIASQDKAGDRIYWSLVEAWKRAGSPAGRQVLRIRHNFGSADEGNYYIEIGGNTGDPDFNTLLWLNIGISSWCREGTFHNCTDGISWWRGLPTVSVERRRRVG